LGDAGSAGMLAQVTGEALDVEAQPLGVPDEVAGSERVLMLEQKIVHFPEGALGGGGLRRLRGELRVGVDVTQRQVPPDEAEVREVRAWLRMRTVASVRRRASEASVATKSAIVKPTPAIVPPPATAAHPTGARSRPPLSRVSSQELPRIPAGLPST